MLEDLDIEGTMILKWTLREIVWEEDGSGEYGYEHSGRRTVKCKDCYALLRISATWNWFYWVSVDSFELSLGLLAYRW
jgi:hypothetical protein